MCCRFRTNRVRSSRAAFADHATHLIVHGTLHLQGWDHETSDDDADAMEAEERVILQGLGVADPYSDEYSIQSTEV